MDKRNADNVLMAVGELIQKRASRNEDTKEVSIGFSIWDSRNNPVNEYWISWKIGSDYISLLHEKGCSFDCEDEDIPKELLGTICYVPYSGLSRPVAEAITVMAESHVNRGYYFNWGGV